MESETDKHLLQSPFTGQYLFRWWHFALVLVSLWITISSRRSREGGGRRCTLGTSRQREGMWNKMNHPVSTHFDYILCIDTLNCKKTDIHIPSKAFMYFMHSMSVFYIMALCIFIDGSWKGGGGEAALVSSVSRHHRFGLKFKFSWKNQLIKLFLHNEWAVFCQLRGLSRLHLGPIWWPLFSPSQLRLCVVQNAALVPLKRDTRRFLELKKISISWHNLFNWEVRWSWC